MKLYLPLLKKILDSNDMPVNLSVLGDAIEHHELARDILSKSNIVVVQFDDTEEQVILSVSESRVAVELYYPVACTPAGANDIIFEEGFCHTGDAMEATAGLQIPDSLVEFNFKDIKNAKRCGCCHCGSIFTGSEVTQCTHDGRGDQLGTAFCPKCGMDTVIAEQGDIQVTENNLWRWFRHMFGMNPMYQHIPAAGLQNFR